MVMSCFFGNNNNDKDDDKNSNDFFLYRFCVFMGCVKSFVYVILFNFRSI